MRAADYDLTGQTIWPAAQMLADYLADHKDTLASCKHACELGAGLGFVGIFAAQACPVILTDHNDIVMRVLSKNALLSQSSHSIRFKLLPTAALHSTPLEVQPGASHYGLCCFSQMPSNGLGLTRRHCYSHECISQKAGARVDSTRQLMPLFMSHLCEDMAGGCRVSSC